MSLHLGAPASCWQRLTAGAAARSLFTSLISLQSARPGSPRFRRCGPSHYPEVFASTHMHKRKDCAAKYLTCTVPQFFATCPITLSPGGEAKWARQGAGWSTVSFLPFCRHCILLRVMFRSPNIVSLALSPAPVAPLGTKWVSFGCSDHLQLPTTSISACCTSKRNGTKQV